MNGPMPKDRSGFVRVLERHLRRGQLSNRGDLLVVGATDEDAVVMRNAGWDHVQLSTYPVLPGSREAGRYLQVDVEDIDLPDEAFDTVLAHEVLHHCQSPHRGLCEMLRVAQRYVVFLEPNDSALMRTLCRLGLGAVFEISAVVAHEFSSGGVRNSHVPNYVFRFNRHDVEQAVLSYVPERVTRVHAFPYWEMNATEYELELKRGTRFGTVMALVGGPRPMSLMMRAAEGALNLAPLTRNQGNKFFCCIEKTDTLREWLRRDEGAIVFNRSYVRSDTAARAAEALSAQLVCPLCGGEAPVYMRLAHTAVRRCQRRDCQLQFAEAQLAQDALRATYERLYYPDGDAAPRIGGTPVADLRELVRVLEQRYGSVRGKRVLDYGCGGGPLLRILLEMGADAVGVEQSANARRMAARTGAPIYASVDELRRSAPDAQFDWVLLSVVVEHLRRPWEELRQVGELLRLGGGVFLTTPNAASLKSRLRGRSWHQRNNLTHFYYFTPTALGAVLRAAGLEPEELAPIANYTKHGVMRRGVQYVLRSGRLQGDLLFAGTKTTADARLSRLAPSPLKSAEHETGTVETVPLRNQ